MSAQRTKSPWVSSLSSSSSSSDEKASTVRLPLALSEWIEPSMRAVLVRVPRVSGRFVWVLAGLALPYLVGTDVFHLGELTYVLSIMIVVIGQNIVLGFAGQYFLGPGGVIPCWRLRGGLYGHELCRLAELPSHVPHLGRMHIVSGSYPRPTNATDLRVRL